MTSHRSNPSRYGLTLHIVEQGTQPIKHSSANEAIVEIGKEIVFDPSTLDTYHYKGWKPVHHDLLVVCAAVEFADRRIERRVTHWSRSFHIHVPVLELTAWQKTKVQTRLQDTLCHLTGNDWHFIFVQARNSVVNNTRQRPLPFYSEKEFVIAYSDGLDSRCVSGLFEKGESVVRVRVTKNKNRVKDAERPFDQIPFAVKLASPRESSGRSRGFKFSAITAIAAHLSDVHKILVPESGQGALGPVLLPLHNIYADYCNHPTFFRKMECFVEALLGYSVTYEQPRLWYTKGDTISAFLAHSEKGQEPVLSTRSCWQQRWNVRFSGKLRQCGLCLACLLRRMSMHTAKVYEPADTYTVSNLTATCYDDAIPRSNSNTQVHTMLEYGIVGARHLQQLADVAKLPAAFLPHASEIALATGVSEQDTHNNLKKLLLKHADEWHEFVNAQGHQSLIKNWTKGGCYD